MRLGVGVVCSVCSLHRSVDADVVERFQTVLGLLIVCAKNLEDLQVRLNATAVRFVVGVVVCSQNAIVLRSV